MPTLNSQQNLSSNDPVEAAQEQAYVTGTNRATVMYEQSDDLSEVTDDELQELPALEETDVDELPDLDDLPEDPEGEGEDDFVEGSPRFEQFRSDFDKAFGLPMEEAKELVQKLREDADKRAINEQKYELSAAWDVSVTEVEQRLAVVAKLWSKLPKDKQQAYDTPKGAQALYARHLQQQTRVSTAKSTQSSTKSTATTSSKYWYTQSQIERMSQSEYTANSDRIMVAYAQGKVQKR